MERNEIPTPPYLIAKPVVTGKKLELQSFLALATDGWDMCTNRDVVDLVVRRLEARPDSTSEDDTEYCMVEKRASAESRLYSRI
jgi:pyruvate dehydrogenase phosphatase